MRPFVNSKKYIMGTDALHLFGKRMVVILISRLTTMLIMKDNLGPYLSVYFGATNEDIINPKKKTIPKRLIVSEGEQERPNRVTQFKTVYSLS